MAQDKRGNFDVKRSNYFQGMMLVDKDFKDEQSYHRQMRQNHNLELHTWGVVRGLDVSLAAGGAVTVSEGLAIDASGREVWWKGGAIQAGGQSVEGSYLVIEWNQEERDEYPQMAGKHLRLIDTASFSWKSDAGDSDVVLAQLLQGKPDNRLRRNAASVRANGNDIEIRPVTRDGALRLMTGLGERLTIDSAGNVGIGTTAPQVPLHIKFPGGASGNAGVLNLEGTDHVYMQWYPLGFASGRKGWMGYGSANEKNFTIQNEYADGHLNLFSASGRVGIGTASPAAALQVRPTPNDKGNATFFSGVGAMFATATNNGGSALAAAETALVLARAGIGGQAYANFARFDLKRYENVDTSSRTQLDMRLSHENLGDEANSTPVIMSLRSNGNVGIGLLPTAARLSIHTTPGPYDGNLMDFVVAQYKLSLRSKALERDTVSYHFDLVNNLGRADDFLVFHKGNIGIGVTNPQNALDVKGDLYIRKGALQFADENGNRYKDNWIGMVNNIDGATQWLHIGGITDSDNLRRLVFAADRTYMAGNVGIGTAQPKSRLEIQGGGGSSTDDGSSAMAFSQSSGGFRHWIRTRHTATPGRGNAIDFYVNNSATADGSSAPTTGTLHVMTLDAGRIGIGTTSPASRLSVLDTTQPAETNTAGTSATPAMIISGGKGGNTTASNQKAGLGASIVLRSGDGGNAPAGGTNGDGGSISLTPGKAGSGAGAPGKAGNVIIAQEGGNVGIGTPSPEAALQVRPTPTDIGSATFFRGASAMFATATNNGGSALAAAETALVLARAGIGGQAYANFARFDLKRYENADTRSRTQLDMRLSHENLGDEANSTPVIMSLRSNGNVGIGTDPGGTNRLRISRQMGGDNADSLQHDFQLEIRNGIGNRALAIGLLDNGQAVLQVKEVNNGAGYKDLLLNPVSGNVGIGTTSPGGQLEIRNSASDVKIKFGGTGGDVHHLSSTRDMVFNSVSGIHTFRKLTSYGDLSSFSNLMTINSEGDVAVKGRISCGGKVAFKSAQWNRYVTALENTGMGQAGALGAWEQFTIEMVCSREFKENISDISGEEAMTTLQNLNPIKYDYKGEKSFRQNLGFIAEEMPDNLASEDRKSLSPLEVIPILTQVAKEQQKSIARLQETLRALQEQIKRRNIDTNGGAELTPARESATNQ